MAKNLVELTDATFENEVLHSQLPVLVDFWAPWCGPCRMLAPTIEQLATEFSGRIKVAKINTDEHNETPSRYRINAIPTIIIFNKGKVANQLVGMKSIEELRAAMNEILED